MQPYGALDCFRWRSEGLQGASGKPPACIDRRQLCRKQVPLAGNDAPTPARADGAAAPTGDSTFFRRERKYQRKHAARRLREKALYCPFWRRGSLCRAQRSWPDYAYHRARSELAFFRRQNGRAFFPPLPIAALLRRSRRGTYLSRAGWDASMWPEGFAAWINGLMFFSHSRRWAYLPCAGWEVPMWLGDFAAQMNRLIFFFTQSA